MKLWKVEYKNSYFNQTPAGKDNTILSTQKCGGLMSPNLWYLLLHHTGFVLSWTIIINTIPNHICKERKTTWRPDILIAVLPNIRVIRDLTECHWLRGSWRSAGTLWYRHQGSSCQTRYSNSSCDWLTLKMKAIQAFETSETSYLATQRHCPKDLDAWKEAQ